MEVEDFPSYAVSSHGRIKNVLHGKEIKPRINSYGHMRVSLRRGGKTYDFYVHQLVARAFLTGFHDGTRVRWHDNNPANNHLENIRFRGERGIGTLRKHVTHARFRRLRIVGTNHIFRTVEDCARFIKGDASAIYKVLRGERLTHMGYTFEFVEDNNE